MRHALLKEYNERAAAAATKIYVVREGAIEEANLPESLAALARANGFIGEAGAVLAGEGGVLIGAGDGGDPFIVAAGADRLPEGDYALADPLGADAAHRACLGWLMGAYRFDRYKSQRPAGARLIAPDGADVNAVRRAADAAALVRDLVNTPAADMTPAALADEAQGIAEDFGAEIRVIVGDDLLEENYPMAHAVVGLSYSTWLNSLITCSGASPPTRVRSS